MNRLKTTLFFILLINITFSCRQSKHSEQNTETVTTATFPTADKCDTVANFPYMEIFIPGETAWNSDAYTFGISKYRFTFDKPTQVYAAPDKDAIISILDPFTQITIEREGIEPQSKVKWYYIRYKGSNDRRFYQDTFGYIKGENIDIGNTYNQFILGKNETGDSNHRFKLVFTPREYASDNVKTSDTLSLDIKLFDIEYYNQYFIEDSRALLKGNPKITRIYWHHGESCPESEGNVFVVKTDTKLVELPHSYASGEYGFSDYKQIYLPVRFDNGKTLLVANADVRNMYNEYDQTTNTIEYPESSGIPINELIVEIEATEEGKSDENGNILEDKNGSPIMEKTHHIIRYYRWDGKEVKLTKEIVHKKQNAEDIQ